LLQSNGQPALVAIYNLDDNTATPLDSQTDTFCSGGSWSGSGILYNSGGGDRDIKQIKNGLQTIRKYKPPGTTMQELVDVMKTKRWYPTVVT